MKRKFEVGYVLTRISGVLIIVLSWVLFYDSLGFCKNLTEILAITSQYDLSIFRLIGLFLLNLLGLIFTWSIAVIMVLLGLYCILATKQILDELFVNND